MTSCRSSSYRGINDPIHGWIKIPTKIFNIIDTPMFQRLGYVTQMTLSGKVFPGANHTRKEHSLGVMHLADEYSRHLFTDKNICQILAIAGLLHDIGHGPYSHSWDRSIYHHIYPDIEKGHDEHRKTIIEKSFKTILQELGINTNDILECWNSNKLYRAILQGPIGCDRMDFTSRDTHYSGTRHFGHYDIFRMIENSSIIETPNGSRLCYNEKIYPDIIQALDTRNKMYEQVYYHKTSVGMQLMLEQAIEETKEQLKLVERTKDLDKFVYLTDAVLFEMMSLSQKAQDIYHRKFPKLQRQYIQELTQARHLKESWDVEAQEWTSPIITNDYEKEFTKNEIFIYTKKQGPVPFDEYWRNQKESMKVSYWRIVRQYN